MYLICFIAIALIPSNLYVNSYVSEEEKLKIIFSRHSKYSECDCIQAGGIHSHIRMRFYRQELGSSHFLAALADYCFMNVGQLCTLWITSITIHNLKANRQWKPLTFHSFNHSFQYFAVTWCSYERPLYLKEWFLFLNRIWTSTKEKIGNKK